MTAEIVGKKMYLEGYMYQLTCIMKRCAYWLYTRVQYKECRACAITSDPADGSVVIFKGPKDSEHTHPPNVDENTAAKLTATVK